ncbi:ATP-binding protein [Nitrosophilus labii]|uniref:ATP-binding protein n=1 Tax=Nitrosophilus labii TaxID=2706014 RepID=UPI00165760C6|nr:ATP-binding protein [Nitrosophilus labii]
MEIKISNIEQYLDFNSIDFAKIKWVEPVFVCVYKAFGEDNGRVHKTNNSYIDHMLDGNYKEWKTYSPIEHIISRAKIEEISQHLTNVLLKNIDITGEDKEDIKNLLQYLFTEMMNNVIDHSHSIVGGYAMAQYYPQKNVVQFAIADRGIGFLKNVKTEAPYITTEYDAIEKALEKGFTASAKKIYGQERNAGFGLYAFQKFVKHIGGQFIIISNDGIYKEDIYNYPVKKKLECPYKGVIVAFELHLNNITLTYDDIINMLIEDGDDEQLY